MQRTALCNATGTFGLVPQLKVYVPSESLGFLRTDAKCKRNQCCRNLNLICRVERQVCAGAAKKRFASKSRDGKATHFEGKRGSELGKMRAENAIGFGLKNLHTMVHENQRISKTIGSTTAMARRV